MSSPSTDLTAPVPSTGSVTGSQLTTSQGRTSIADSVVQKISSLASR